MERLISESIMLEDTNGRRQFAPAHPIVAHTKALNVVRSWNPQSASVTAAVPVFCSLAVSILWSAICTLKYEADVQASVQIGFTVGGYIVTTGK